MKQNDRDDGDDRETPSLGWEERIEAAYLRIRAGLQHRYAAGPRPGQCRAAAACGGDQAVEALRPAPKGRRGDAIAASGTVFRSVPQSEAVIL